MSMYICGPMTGIQDYNYPLFNRTARLLEEEGVDCINPAANFGGDQSLEYETYMKEAERAVREDATSILLLPGWQGSNGARRELKIALERNLQIFIYQEDSRQHEGFWFWMGDKLRSFYPKRPEPKP